MRTLERCACDSQPTNCTRLIVLHRGFNSKAPEVAGRSNTLESRDRVEC